MTAATDHPLWVSHLEAAGFVRHPSGVAIWHWYESGRWVDGGRFVCVTPTGHNSWTVAVNDGSLPVEVATVGGLRRSLSVRGVEPWF